MSRRAQVLGFVVVLAAVCGSLWLLALSSEDDAGGPHVADAVETAADDAQPERRHVERAEASADVATPETEAALPTREPAHARLVVRVTVEAGGPVEGAEVRVTGWGAQIGGTRRRPIPLAAGRADAAGVCRLSIAYPAQFLVLARHGNLAGTAGDMVVTGRATRQIDVSLGPARRVEGRTVDAIGRPVPGVHVTGTFRRRRLALHHYLETVTSDAAGTFRFGPVPETLVCGVVELTTPETGATLRHRRNITEADGDQDWDVTVVRTSDLSARIVLANGEAAAGARVSVSVLEGPGSVQLLADDDGRVAGRVPRGRVVLRASVRVDGPESFIQHARELEIGAGGVELGTIVLDGEDEAFRDPFGRSRRDSDRR